ncbi:MAG: T9SS type A sorting domain-containing protein, partial [Candidatus Cloacimonetes bacterium]|nr:T9SS type A sorting domain-containing protein [Candidatus Cloacimonadota bacterium]
YWDTQTSGTASSAGGTGYTTTQMKIQSNFINWAFVTIWGIDAGINDGYPFLMATSNSVFYYRTRASSSWINGIAWSSVTAWEYSPDSSIFSPAVVVPDFSNSVGILINHHVLQDIDRIIDHSTISASGKLTINSGKTLQINNGDGTDLAIDGELTVTGIFSVGSGALVTAGSASLITFNGSVAQSAGVGFPSPVNNLTLANAAGLSFANPLVINGVLRIDSGFVSGITDTDGYHSVGLNYLEIGETGTLISNFSAATAINAGNFPEKIERQWSLSGTLADIKTLTFYWTSADDHGYAWGSKVPSAFVGSAEFTPGAGDYNVSSDPRWLRIAVSDFEAAKGLWTIGESNEETLPVELSSFTATISLNNQVQLMWVTQSETNVSGFRIYRGLVNNASEALQLSVFIPATNSSQAQHYLYEDTELFAPGYYYYWLESNDLEGSSELFGPVGVQYNFSDGPNIPVPLVNGIKSIYPNPFNPITTISFSMEKDAPVEISIYNQKGQAVRRLAASSMSKGNHRLSWDGRDDNGRSVSSGIYLMKLNLGGELFTRKLTLQK